MMHDPGLYAVSGRIESGIDRKADTAVEVVYSIPVPYKEGLTCNL